MVILSLHWGNLGKKWRYGRDKKYPLYSVYLLNLLFLSTQIKASLLLSSHGQEIPKISDRLKSLGTVVEAPDITTSVCDTDIDGELLFIISVLNGK